MNRPEPETISRRAGDRAGRRRRDHAAAALAALVCAACASCLTAGCAGGASGGRGKPPDPLLATAGVDVLWLSVDDTAPPQNPAPTSAARSAARDTRAPLGAALAAVEATPPEVPPAVLDAWKRSGLAVYTIPTEKVSTLRSLMRESGAGTQQRAFGVTLAWAEMFRGATCEGPTPVDLGGGPTELRAGFFRLLMRCYPVPVLGSAACRVELVPQLIDSSSRADRGRAAGLGGAASQGMVFASLLFEIDLTAGRALVITSDHEGPAPMSDAPSVDDADEQEPVRTRVYGPTPDAPHTLGEAMMSRVLAGGSPLSRSVLILTPRPGRPITLLGE
jgi:hypothetical protein